MSTASQNTNDVVFTTDQNFTNGQEQATNTPTAVKKIAIGAAILYVFLSLFITGLIIALIFTAIKYLRKKSKG